MLRGLGLVLFGVGLTWLLTVVLGRAVSRRGFAFWVWDRSGSIGRVLIEGHDTPVAQQSIKVPATAEVISASPASIPVPVYPTPAAPRQCTAGCSAVGLAVPGTSPAQVAGGDPERAAHLHGGSTGLRVRE